MITSFLIFLENFSNHEAIGWFKKIVLIGSPEDEFVPYASATARPELIENEKAKISCKNFIRLAKNIERLEIWFNAENLANSFEKLIGKRSHIEFIDNDMFMRIVFHLYSSQF